MRMNLATAFVLLACFSTAGCTRGARRVAGTVSSAQARVEPSVESGSDEGDETDEQAWRSASAILNTPGELREGVYTITVPRADLILTVHDNEVPTAAGIASVFHFYRCPCGRINVIGQFVVADYEANDVVDALREGNEIEVAAIAPLLLHERPRLLLIRFQGEAHRAAALANLLKQALSWTGKERMAPQFDGQKDEGTP